MDVTCYLKTSEFWYDLPPELIAQTPAAKRDGSRLLVLDRTKDGVEHRHFYDILEYVRAGDCLVLNNSRVLPVRLIGSRKGGGAAEILLLKDLGDDIWECLCRPGRKLREGDRVSIGDGQLTAEITGILSDGRRLAQFTYEGVWLTLLESLGAMPLPPYITEKPEDSGRYQTVYAKINGSAAAPTAGLHFTPELLIALEQKGVSLAELTLHVGLGTFRPVVADNTEDHIMHSEWYTVPLQAAETINRTRAAGGRIIAVGTTSVRTLETAVKDNALQPCSGNTDIFITPGYRFQAIDGLITNFHLPESTLMMLISALAGRERILSAYQEAIRARYRFFSFGDAMLIL